MTGYIARLVVEHTDRTILWSPAQLKMLVGKVHISDIYTSSLKFTDENVENFWQIISSFENCKLHFPSTEGLSWSKDDKPYKFSVSDMKLLSKYDIKIPFMSSSVLRTKGLDRNLRFFIPTLNKLKHLERFDSDTFI